MSIGVVAARIPIERIAQARAALRLPAETKPSTVLRESVLAIAQHGDPEVETTTEAVEATTEATATPTHDVGRRVA